MNFQITDIDLNAVTPECKTPTEIVSCVMSICKKINFPQPDIKGLKKMNDCQVAYSLTKVLYSQSFEEANKATEAECERIGLNLERGDDEALDKWSEIDSKYDGVYAVGHFMYLKWQAEKMMVENSFKIIEADPKIKSILAKDNADYLKIKANWERPSIRSKIVNLAFKLKA